MPSILQCRYIRQAMPFLSEWHVAPIYAKPGSPLRISHRRVSFWLNRHVASASYPGSTGSARDCNMTDSHQMPPPEGCSVDSSLPRFCMTALQPEDT